MRVAFYAPLKPPDHPVPSGDRRIARLFLDALRLAGHEPFVASRLRSFEGAGDAQHQARLSQAAGRTVERLLRRWRRAPGSAPELWFTYHLYHKAPDWLGPAISSALGIPYVVAEASLAPKRAGGIWNLGHREVAAALRRADLVIGLNPADRECVLPLLRDPRRWIALPLFLDAACYGALRTADRSMPPRLIAVAMMRDGDKLASYRLLGTALAGLLDLSWSLEIIGDGPARREVEDALAPLGSRVVYRGMLGDAAVADALAAADLLVWPAINEAFGMALLEAQASGLPVVAGASGGVAGIVADGVTGVLAPPGDAAAFAAAVRRLLKDDAARGAMGAAARAKVEREHDLPAAAARLAAIIERAATGAGGVTGRVLIYVQYLLGIGHLQRSLRVADALAQRGIGVTLVSGGPPTALPRNPAIHLVQLPPVRALDANFALIDSAGAPLGEALRESRRTALLAALDEAAPDAVVVEGYPFARRAFRFELEPLIAALDAMRPRPRLFCSVRDIVVVRDDPVRHRDIVERVRRDFDAVLVHGDPALVPFEASFPAAPQIADQLIYTGYVAPPAAAADAAATIGAGEVLVSAGGGAAGYALLQAALAARRAGCLANLPWRLISGARLPDADFAALEAAAPPGVAVERFRPDLPALLQRCAVSVSQAGYNTVLDILAARARAVLVPFAAGRETEQLLRAERLVALGAAELVRESELTPERLAAAIELCVARPPALPTIEMDGAARAARLIAATIRPGSAASRDLAAATRRDIVAQ
ncbi:MAG TPA: glycosyltransferase [Stellaceae bacterium]|nr:glycosyltransferase [Stellaceae bacterium]